MPATTALRSLVEEQSAHSAGFLVVQWQINRLKSIKQSHSWQRCPTNKLHEQIWRWQTYSVRVKFSLLTAGRSQAHWHQKNPHTLWNLRHARSCPLENGGTSLNSPRQAATCKNKTSSSLSRGRRWKKWHTPQTSCWGETSLTRHPPRCPRGSSCPPGATCACRTPGRAGPVPVF